MYSSLKCFVDAIVFFPNFLCDLVACCANKPATCCATCLSEVLTVFTYSVNICTLNFFFVASHVESLLERPCTRATSEESVGEAMNIGKR